MEQPQHLVATFFVTLAGAVGAALAFTLDGKSRLEAGAERLPVLFALIVLLVLGYATSIRLVGRNVASDRYKRRLNRIRRYFLSGEHDPRLRVLPFEPYKLEPRRLWSWNRIAADEADRRQMAQSVPGPATRRAAE